MRIGDLKRYLRPYSMYASRSTTINNAFASALAPCDAFDTSRANEAVEYLGQNANDLSCVYCGRPAETWDHLIGLVKNAQLRGYGHQLGNLIPCCKPCNGKKGGKDWQEFIGSSITDPARREAIRLLLIGYLDRFARPIDLTRAELANPEDWRRYQDLRLEVLSLLKQADEIATRLRQSIVQG